MADLISWEKDSTRKLQREIADLLDEFRLPRGFRREMDRVFDDFASARPLWREMDRLLDDFVAATAPRFMRVTAKWYVRGGIFTTVVAEHRQRGWKPAPRVELEQLPSERSTRG